MGGGRRSLSGRRNRNWPPDIPAALVLGWKFV
jgi:hypothetical protein